MHWVELTGIHNDAPIFIDLSQCNNMQMVSFVGSNPNKRVICTRICSNNPIGPRGERYFEVKETPEQILSKPPKLSTT